MKSIAARVSATLAGALVVSVLLVLVIELVFHGHRQREQVEQRYQLLLEQVERSLLLAMRLGRQQGMDEVLAQVTDAGEVVGLAVVDVLGRRLHAAGQLPAAGRQRGLADDYEQLSRRPASLEITRLGQERVLARKVLVRRSACGRCHGHDVPAAFLEAVFDTKELAATYRQESYLLLALLLVQALVFFSLWLMLRRWMLRPLRRLVTTIDRVASGRFEERAALNSPSELALVAHHFNNMLERLQKARDVVDSQYAQSMARVEQLAAVGQLAASAAHEIRNQVGGLAAGIKVLQRQQAARDLGPVLDEMSSVAERLVSSAAQLLDFSRPVKPSLGPQDANACVRSVLSFIAEQAEASSVDLGSELAQDLPPVHADLQQLQQVLLNLCLNAIQVQPRGGRLHVATSSDGATVRVAVADAGPGIDEQSRSRVFEAFYTSRPGGTGLGLTISRQMVEAMGGKLELAPASGTGTTFLITLPVWHGAGKVAAGVTP